MKVVRRIRKVRSRKQQRDDSDKGSKEITARRGFGQKAWGQDGFFQCPHSTQQCAGKEQGNDNDKVR